MKLRLLLFLTMLSLVGCQLDELRDDFRPSSHKAFSIEEAREFFEKDYVDRQTKSQEVDKKAGRFRGRIHPGDFTPLWDKSVYSESDGVAAYDVDILADRSIFAIRSKFGRNGARAQKLKVYQKLVVRLNVESGKMAAYVMSIIPDVGCDDRRIPERFRSRGKDKGGFSGIVVYATTERGAIVRVQEYSEGVLKRGVYIPSGKGTYIDRCVKAREILNGVTLMSKRNIQTRSGEDDWSDFYGGELDESICIGDNAGSYGLEYLGYGIYTDGEGHYYLDIDEDGDVDLETIAPSYVEADDPDEPKPYDDENENANDDGGDDEAGDDENANGNEDDIPEDDLPPGDEDIDEDMVALGREGVEKIAADLESGNVNVYQYLDGALTGLGVGANANGIITSAANFVKELAEDTLLQAFGRSISAVGVACGGLQTFVAIVEGDEFSVGDWMNVVSTTLGVAAILSSSFPIVAGGLGVASGIVGLASIILSENIQPGFYIIEIAEGSRLYLYVGNVTLS